MRITKKWLRDARTRICNWVEGINNLNDADLRAVVDGVVRDVPADATRTQLLILAIKDRVYHSLPDTMCG